MQKSGNNPDHHFTGSGKQIEFGKGATQTVEDVFYTHNQFLGKNLELNQGNL